MPKPVKTEFGWWQPHRGTIHQEDEVPTLFACDAYGTLALHEEPTCVVIEFGGGIDTAPDAQLVLSHQNYIRLVDLFNAQFDHYGKRAMKKLLANLTAGKVESVRTIDRHYDGDAYLEMTGGSEPLGGSE